MAPSIEAKKLGLALYINSRQRLNTINKLLIGKEDHVEGKEFVNRGL